jgi:hypothetical protein
MKRVREKHTIYNGSPHKSGVLQSLTLSRDFIIISLDYNCSTTLARDFSMLNLLTRDF